MSNLRGWIYLILFVLMAQLGCAVRDPIVSFPGEPLPACVLEGWGRAQEELLELDPPLRSDPRQVSPHWFTWIEQTRVHRCYDVERAEGCFSTDKVIQYRAKFWVIVHESRHAIAYAADDPRWRDIGH